MYNTLYVGLTSIFYLCSFLYYFSKVRGAFYRFVYIAIIVLFFRLFILAKFVFEAKKANKQSLPQYCKIHM